VPRGVRIVAGARAFIKAVGAELNPNSPVLFRREVQALTLLGSHPLWADLLAAYDDGSWVALLLEDVEGTHPDLADDATMGRLVAQTDELVRTLADRVPDPPTPAPPDDRVPLFRPGPVDLHEVFSAVRDGVAHAPDVPEGWLPAWVLDELPLLLELVELLLAEPNDHVVHYDIRNDNLLQRPSGELVFLDWGAFGVGPGWLDPLLARLERVHTGWFDDSLASSPALVAAGDDVVTGLMAGMGAYLAWRAYSDPALNMPTLQAFRRAESARFLSAARRRLDLRG
jgi:hypothetical protein